MIGRESAIIDCLPPRRGSRGPVWSVRLVALLIVACAIALVIELFFRR